MITRITAQILLATSFLQFFPYDAGVVEQYAHLPEAEVSQVVGVSEAVSLLYKPFPTAKEADLSPKKIKSTSIGVWTSAVTALVVDKHSGSVLFEKNIDEPRSIGSITKLMTALVFLDGNPNLDAPAAVLPEDRRAGGRDYVNTNDEITIRGLLMASLVSSDNSATMSLVRLSGMSEGDFVARMNEYGAGIGFTNTTFTDPTGLSAHNRSIAPDIVLLLLAALDNEVIRSLTELEGASISAASGRNYDLEPTNELLASFLNEAPYKIIGGKTGFLPEAGYCLGVQVERKPGEDIFVVVLGSDSKEGRFRDVKALSAWSFEAFAWPGSERIN